MKSKKVLWSILTVIMLLSMTVGSAWAEDTDPNVLFRKNISKTPDNETEKAAIYMMDFYVPAQSSSGVVGPVENYCISRNDDGTCNESAYDPRDYAKPLVTVWIDDLHPVEETKGGITFGHFDAFVGISVDDGTTWKTTNLSNSSDLSSFILKTGYEYPGDVHNVVHQVAGDRIFVAWASKYCDGGTPLYTLDATIGTEGTYDNTYLDDLSATYGLDDVYLVDYFGVSGTQRSVNYEEQGFPDIGEIPFSCIWTARGKLIAGDDLATTDTTEATHVVWTKPERLTSGRRDANLPAVDCAKDAGCILTWQEDPEGLRPGQGLGPGEGWSGAIANQQTDIWYSYISYDNFDDVLDDVDGVVDMELFSGDTMPKAYVPMAMPTRLTDNHMCKTGKGEDNLESQQLPYCFADFSTTPVTLSSLQNDSSTYCSSTESWTNPGGTTLNICVTDDNRLLNGRVASTRVRLNLKPYTKADGTVSAWVIMAYEETKALGDTATDTTDPIDIGKDVWYHSFDMFDHDMVAQGGMLNQPAVCKNEDDPFCTDVGAFYDIQVDTRVEPNEFYLTEISRRFALTTNSVTAAVNSLNKLSAMLIYKQGIINQGGPADIMLRRVVLPTGFDKTKDNPYAFENMECAEWDYLPEGDDRSGKINPNPNYLKGVCLSPAINISGTTIVECDNSTSGADCAASFPVADDGSTTLPDETSFPKVTEWRQCDGVADIDSCEGDNDLDDQSWENPYDVAKGHRGFLDGDIVMMMYAWAPNWKANTVGNDHYNLYVRRSFDGGLTWTTTPPELSGDGTTTCEWYGLSGLNSATPPYEVCTDYGPGDFEQARNVSQLVGNKITILDPRYSPTGGLKLYPTIRTDWLAANGFSIEGLPYADDSSRDSSKFFVIYETGDNTTVAEGEAVPLDLYYSRGTNYGDDYEIMEYYTSDGTIKEYWPWLENKQDDLSGEASVVANPGGTFMYAVWNQWKEEILPDGHELVFDSDIIFRRLMYLMDGEADEQNFAPVATILSSTQEVFGVEEDQIITLFASARDLDTLGVGDPIQEYVWTINGVAVPEEFQEEFKEMGFDCFKDKQCNAPARVVSGHWDGYQFQQPGWSGQNNYQYGWYEFALQVKDNDDPAKWSKIVKVKKYIGQTAADVPFAGFKIFLPLTTK